MGPTTCLIMAFIWLGSQDMTRSNFHFKLMDAYLGSEAGGRITELYLSLSSADEYCLRLKNSSCLSKREKAVVTQTSRGKEGTADSNGSLSL
ncbi:hypothetical protein DsansV1_C29g0213241 [Dioscorea sansibarensis]